MAVCKVLKAKIIALRVRDILAVAGGVIMGIIIWVVVLKGGAA